MMFLVELNDCTSDAINLFQVEAESREEAADLALIARPNCTVVQTRCVHGGKRVGAGRPNQWGDRVKTKPCRLPVNLAENIHEVIGEMEVVRGILQIWEEKVFESMARSGGGKPAERYKHVAELTSQLRYAMSLIDELLD
jgi:hypothetical protein